MLLSLRSNSQTQKYIYKRVMDCYELRSLGWDNRTTLVLSNTRELDRDPFTK